MSNLEKLNKLYEEGQDLLKTRMGHKPGIAFPEEVNHAKFVKWKHKTLSFLQIISIDEFRFNTFKNELDHNYYYLAEKGVSILESIIEDIEDGTLDINSSPKANLDKIQILEEVLNNFHRVVRQLRNRHDNRTTLEIKDEYDVQDLLHSLLLIHFDDVRPEEYTPSYAGATSRMDFLIKDINTVIETKMTRENLKDKKLGEELIIDIEKYAKHLDCEKLYCFVYDPKEFINNPKGLEKDLSNNSDEIEVKTIIVPKY